ncbi:unnamed protein product [Phytomonas sp. EM1]|nr:unnamed protein product [Phytomonas sp. EM1]|eukprot:CCW60807.1 unnamed protein product [Phytomonas sp. isolate EM1]
MKTQPGCISPLNQIAKLFSLMKTNVSQRGCKVSHP